MRIYIASSLHNVDTVKQIRDKFLANGFKITYDWTSHGQVFTKTELRNYGKKELAGVLEADILYFIQPGRKGAHTELGIMLGAHTLIGGKIIIIVEEEGLEIEQKPFYYLDCINKFTNHEEAFEFIMREKNEHHNET